MRLVIGLRQQPGGHPRVHIRRVQTRMPQQLLDAAQVRAAVQHVRGEGVPQLVRRHRLEQPRLQRELLERVAHALPRPRLPARRHKQLLRHCALLGRQLPAKPQILAHCVLRGPAEDDLAHAPALALHRELAAVRPVVRQPQRQQFVDAHAGGVQQLNQRAVARRYRAFPRRRRHQRVHFLRRQHHRRLRHELAEFHRQRRVACQHALFHQVAAERGDGGKLPPCRAHSHPDLGRIQLMVEEGVELGLVQRRGLAGEPQQQLHVAHISRLGAEDQPGRRQLPRISRQHFLVSHCADSITCVPPHVGRAGEPGLLVV